jgi:spore germination protein
MKRIFLWAFAAALIFPSAPRAEYKTHKKGPVGISGWVIFWDQGNKSLGDFEKHADQMDRAYFEWYKCEKDGLPHLIVDVKDELKARAIAAATKHNVETWYTTGNYSVELGHHDPERIQKFLYDSALRAQHIKMLIDFAKKDNIKGIQIDYENIMAKDKQPFTTFMNELGKACKDNGLYLGIALPPKTDSEGTWDDPQSRDYAAIGKVADQFAPMTYDLHWSTSTAGAVTSPEWAEMVIKYAASVMEPGRLEVGYPAYGYDWVGNKGESINWARFQELMTKYKVTPQRDTDYSQELFISFTDEKGAEHQAWMPDALCLELQSDIVKKYKLFGIAVWYIGAAEESFWTTMKKVNASTEPTGKIEAPPADAKLDIKNFLTDKQGVAYAYAYPAASPQNPGGSKITIVEKKGKRWVDVILKGDVWAGCGMGVNRTNLARHREKGALQFFVRGAKGGESFDIGFVMDKGLTDEEKYTFENNVPITNYCEITTKWQLVTIPLADFPLAGHKYDDKNGQQIKGTFQWKQILEVSLAHAPGADPIMEVQLSSIRVVPTYNAKALEKAKDAMGK